MSALVATTADAVVVSAGAAIGDIEYRDYTDETMLFQKENHFFAGGTVSVVEHVRTVNIPWERRDFYLAGF